MEDKMEAIYLQRQKVIRNISITAKVSPVLNRGIIDQFCNNLVNLHELGSANKNRDSLLLVFHNFFWLRKEKISLIFDFSLFFRNNFS